MMAFCDTEMTEQRRPGGIRLIPRRGNDWINRYPLDGRRREPPQRAVVPVDGEVVACDESGLAVFDLLRHGPSRKTFATLIALLELDGADLHCKPTEVRKATLASACATVEWGMGKIEDQRTSRLPATSRASSMTGSANRRRSSESTSTSLNLDASRPSPIRCASQPGVRAAMAPDARAPNCGGLSLPCFEASARGRSLLWHRTRLCTRPL
jgi:hypothetical protein